MTRAPRLLLGLVSLLLASCATAPPPSKPAPTAAPAPAAPAPSLPKPRHPGLTLAAVGDIMPGTDFPENILPDDDGLSFLDRKSVV